MASSVFKEYPSSSDLKNEYEDEKLRIDPNLVILVNKEGKVSVDERTLHSLLGERKVVLVFLSEF